MPTKPTGRSNCSDSPSPTLTDPIRNWNLLAFKKREKRKEANAQKGTKQGYQTEEKRDYALEYALWTHRKQDELQKKVSDALWRDKDGYVMHDGQ